MNQFRSLLLVLAFVAMAGAIVCSAKTDLRAATTRPAEWFRTDEAKTLVDNVLSWQRPDGAWNKLYDNATKHAEGTNFGGEWQGAGTIDNNATTTEMRFLAAAYHATKRDDLPAAFTHGLDYLISSQYDNGGFPQRFPLTRENYSHAITFNDDAMVHVMELLDDVGSGSLSDVVDAPHRRSARTAFDKGIDCILKCQITSDRKLTVWCQQHDAQTLAPVAARRFELVGLCSTESAGVTVLLMRIHDPSQRVRQAIESAVAWFEASKITGKRQVFIADPQSPGQRRRTIVDDPAAPVIWTRYYEIDTNRPFFCDRNGNKKYSIDEIDRERSTGYAWYSYVPQKVLDAYPEWKQRVGEAK